MSNHDHELVHDQTHVDLLGRNAFIATMIGAVAFVASCLWVMFQ
jgi:hypothetical protein